MVGCDRIGSIQKIFEIFFQQHLFDNSPCVRRNDFGRWFTQTSIQKWYILIVLEPTCGSIFFLSGLENNHAKMTDVGERLM